MMKSKHTSQLALLDRFRDLSRAHFENSQRGDYERVNTGVQSIGGIIRELWEKSGQAGLAEIAKLSEDADNRVAVMASIYAIELFPEVKKSLKRLSKDKTLVGLSANQTIRNFDAGTHRVLREIVGQNLHW